jgi:hypothetical protein
MEDRIKELEERIEKLERKERKRTILSIVKLGLYLILIGALSFGAYKVYEKVIEVYEPYKEIVDKYNETDSTIKSITDLFK